MAKILYFEGAGWEMSKVGEVENCRIRTAFHNDNGKGIYLEIHGDEYTSLDGYFTGVSLCKVSHCVAIKANGYPEYRNIDVKVDSLSLYSYKGILRVVNSLGCSFDEIVVLPWIAGFRVHAIPGPGFNYGDVFKPDKRLIKQREEVHNHFKACFSNFSCWIDECNPALLHIQEQTNHLRVYFGTPKLNHFLIDVADTEWKAQLKDVS